MREYIATILNITEMINCIITKVYIKFNIIERMNSIIPKVYTNVEIT